MQLTLLLLNQLVKIVHEYKKIQKLSVFSG